MHLYHREVPTLRPVENQSASFYLWYFSSWCKDGGACFGQEGLKY